MSVFIAEQPTLSESDFWLGDAWVLSVTGPEFSRELETQGRCLSDWYIDPPSDVLGLMVWVGTVGFRDASGEMRDIVGDWRQPTALELWSLKGATP